MSDVKIALITSRFNRRITEQLRLSAIQAFVELGGLESQCSDFEVPGAFELPLMAKKVALTRKFDAILCLGAIIKGETAHFEYIASSTVHSLSQVSLETEVPLICGVLTTYTLVQAEERAFGAVNLGKSFLFTALEMIELCHSFKE